MGVRGEQLRKTCKCNIQRIFSALKIENNFDIFARNIDFGNTLELPSNSNKYPQYMFWSKKQEK